MPEPETLVGETVDDRWFLVRRIGAGRFGEVYAAEARHLDLAAGAVKFVRPESPAHRDQVLREIQTLSELSQENLVTYRDSGRITEGVLADTIYIVTELC
ncbi:MAG: protein kinase domain-containing protein, partial [Acidimicrobiales bacterium]